MRLSYTHSLHRRRISSTVRERTHFTEVADDSQWSDSVFLLTDLFMSRLSSRGHLADDSATGRLADVQVPTSERHQAAQRAR